VQRSLHKFPKQGSKSPWRLHQNYLLDIMTLGFGKLDDGAMEFQPTRPESRALPEAVAET
jgi:hypothetical protein